MKVLSLYILIPSTAACCRLGILLIESSDFARLIMVLMSDSSQDFFHSSEDALNVRLEGF